MGNNGWEIGKRKARLEVGSGNIWVTLTVEQKGKGYDCVALGSDENDTFNLLAPQTISRPDIYSINDACVVWGNMVKKGVRDYARSIAGIEKSITVPSPVFAEPARRSFGLRSLSYSRKSKGRDSIRKSFIKGFSKNNFTFGG
jgi:hypothetical protein